MLKTAEELKDQAQKIGLNFYPVHNCTMCNYTCGYLIDRGNVSYDSGCDCTRRYVVEPRNWEDLANTYNMNQPENNPEIGSHHLDELNKTWKFPNTTN